MKITIAQLDPIVGDIEGNYSKLEKTVSDAGRQGAELVVFTELYLCGYPPRDLLERRSFLERIEATIEKVAGLSGQFPGVGILFGAPVKKNRPGGKGLLNAALLARDGNIVFVQAKSLLPTYDVFDESRYFDEALQVDVIEHAGERLGISICEDAWNESRVLYDRDPFQILAEKGASLFINISASPFYVGKEEIRYEVMRAHAIKYHIPVLYVNQVGANDELIFDGRSMFIGPDGYARRVMEPFVEETCTIDTEKLLLESSEKYHYVPPDKIQSLHDALVTGLRGYMKKCGFKKAVLGLSGGIDSAVVASLASTAAGSENVLGITMPSRYSSVGSIEDSRKLAANLGIDFRIVPIEPVFKAYLEVLAADFKGLPFDLAEENLQARIRGSILMAFSNKFGYLVLSTGNKSELAVGYCTLYGDMCGGLAVIADVPKTSVWELARYINREREIIPLQIIEKAPSAELRPDQKDQDTLPPYPLLDAIMSLYIEESLSAEEIVARGFERGTVEWIISNIRKSEYKRRQAPPGLKVTSRAFGSGRKMPVAAKYHD